MSAPSISPIRFSEPRNFAEITDRLNKAMRLLELELQGLQDKITALQAPAKPAGKPGYPGIANGSAAIIQGPAPGGPSPVPPYITPHTMIVGEGSTPVKLLTFLDGQVPIGATGADPAAANLTGDGTSTLGAFGVAILNGPNSIRTALNDSVQLWITTMQLWAVGMQAWAVGVSLIVGVSPPTPLPPLIGPT